MLPFSLIVLLHSFLISIPSVVSLPPANERWRHDTPHTQPIGRIQTKPTLVYKPRSLELLHKRRRQGSKPSSFPGYEEEDLQWDTQEVIGPDVEDRHTLAQLARMAGNAYALPGQRNWYEVDPAWRMSFPFGWDNDEDGFRGQVFMSADNNTVVLSIKGTTISGPTTRLDKFNDNLLFSCCCAKASWVLRPVCDCYAGHMQCDDRCLHDALVQESLFYTTGTKLVDDLLRIYPTANLWLVGHSLGGALASLLGATYGVPAVAFEAPGEKRAAQRLHLPLPPSEPLNETDLATSPFPPPGRPRPPPPNDHPLASYITHVYHTADPIPFGTCTGLYSVCATAGYALETRCHLGKSIILDTVNKLHWLVDVRKHIVREVVHLLDLPEDGGRDVDWSDAGGRGPGDEEPEEPGDPEPEPDPWVWNKEGLQRSFARACTTAFKAAFRWKDMDFTNWPVIPGRGKKKKGEDEDKPKHPNRMPKPILENKCYDCEKWDFGDYKEVWVNPSFEQVAAATVKM